MEFYPSPTESLASQSDTDSSEYDTGSEDGREVPSGTGSFEDDRGDAVGSEVNRPTTLPATRSDGNIFTGENLDSLLWMKH